MIHGRCPSGDVSGAADGYEAAIKAIGAVVLVWFVGTCVFNYVHWQRILRSEDCPYAKSVVLKHAEFYGAMTIFMLGSLDLMTIYPWTNPHVKKTHSYPSKSAVQASIRSAMLEDCPQLAFNIAYFAARGGTVATSLFPIVNCSVTVLQLLWTVFTKMSIVQAFDGDSADGGATKAADGADVQMVPNPPLFDAPTSKAEGARREDPSETELAAATKPEGASALQI